MAELGIFIKTLFDNKGTAEAKKAFGGLGAEAKKMSDQQTKASKQSRDEFSRFVKGTSAGSKKIKLSLGGVKNVAKDTFGILGPAALAGPAAAIAAVAVAAAGLASSSLKAAEASRSVTSAFTSLSGGAAFATVNLRAMTKATRGLISETEQMQIANQLLGMRIVSSADELEEVVGVSRRLGKEFRGLGARDAAEEFAIMIANMSVARLDSFGLSSGIVRKRINELMKETQGMTREAAFFQATMEEGQATIERLGPEILTTADASSTLSAEWANLKVVMGETIEQTGIAKNVMEGLSGNLILLRRAFGDDSAATAVAALNVEIQRVESAIERHTTGFLQNADAADLLRGRLGGLQRELSSLTDEIETQTDATKKQQEAFQAAIRSEEIAAENLAKREAAAARLLDIQEQFAKDILDIQEDIQDQLASSQEQFDDSSIQAAEDHAEKIADIQKRFAKGEASAAKKLQKDLAKIDSDLKKALAKSEKSEGDKVAKAQAGFAKDNKNTQKRKQIDALADERLFQFELRNLAADGQGIAIKEALERRAIEQEIASEKAQFEKEVEQEKRKEVIASLRQEGSEARQQLQQQATERKSDLAERNQEASDARQERLQEELLQENEAFIQKKADLAEALAERDEAIRESERERVEEIAKGLAEVEDLTLAQFDKMIALAEQFGPEFGTVFADGMTEAFSEALKIENLIEQSGLADIGAGAGGLPVAASSNGVSPGGGGGGGIQPFQRGGVINQSGFGFLHAGEQVANPNEGQAIVIDGIEFAQLQAQRMADAINAVRQQDAQMIVDTVAAAL